MSESLDSINAKIKALEDTAGPLLHLQVPANATINFGDNPGMALLMSVCFQRLTLEIQRQGELTREALKVKV